MPSTSAKQHRFMEAVAHNPTFAKKVGVSQSVGKDYAAADKGKKFGRGGIASINKQDTQHGSIDMPFKSVKKVGGMKPGAMARDVDMMARRPRMSASMPAPAMPPADAMAPGMKKGGMAGGMHKMPDGKMMKNSAMNMGGMAGMKKGGMPMKDGGKVKRYDDGGNVSKGELDKQDIAAFGLPLAKKIQENLAENKGYLAGQDKYPAEARLQKDLAVPARIARKTGVYLKEKYGDIKGNVKGMLGDREALRELRGGQLSRDAALGYKKGGMPMKDGKPAFMMGKKMNMGGMAKYAKGGGIESRGKTKGTVIRMAAGGSVSSASRRGDGIAQRGKTRG